MCVYVCMVVYFLFCVRVLHPRSHWRKAIYPLVHQISLATSIIPFRKIAAGGCVRLCARTVITCDISTLISFLVIVKFLWMERLNNGKEREMRVCMCVAVWSRRPTVSGWSLLLFLLNFCIAILHAEASGLTIRIRQDVKEKWKNGFGQFNRAEWTITYS